MKYPPKILVMATKEDCPFCTVMKPVFEEVVKELGNLEGFSYGIYDVNSDDWKLADKLGIEGTPGFAVLSEDAENCYEMNNDGIVDKSVLISMVVNNIHKI